MINNINYNSLNNCSCHKNILEVSTSFGDFKGLPKLQLYFSQNVGDNEDAPVLDFDYYTLHAFHRLSILHTNIRSYQKNFPLLQSLTSSMGFKFDVIGLSETWQTTKDNTTHELPGYYPFDFISGITQNSGCGLYKKQPKIQSL